MYSQLLRLKKVCFLEKDFEGKLSEMKSCFLKRGYPRQINQCKQKKVSFQDSKRKNERN